MGNRKISSDLKLAVIRLHEQRILRLSEILDCVGFSCMTFYRIKKLYNETGNVVKPRSQYTGRPRVFNLEDLHFAPDPNAVDDPELSESEDVDEMSRTLPSSSELSESLMNSALLNVFGSQPICVVVDSEAEI